MLQIDTVYIKAQAERLILTAKLHSPHKDHLGAPYSNYPSSLMEIPHHLHFLSNLY